ncbi:hypothetical protein CIL05_10035 [Virgibacillus profundi]|uniref:Integral inner membrane protein n=1 Tax=Virgibacillus profundi TaxID=2024555 RepID=A0A2A2ICG2_9BACI|nr:hypothetical protein [Virgibacillus profundi]PAV29701.1 hypothetical protein CIL05_10035 [Virgibacillus profundi]PXY53873.1 hypothetical protein CIT14_10130 [Virgibacillus profundi]
MFKRVFMVFLTLIIAVVAVLLAAKHPTGPNTVSYDEPVGLWISLGMIIVLFLPPLILSLFNNRIVKIISVVYQAFVVISFLVLIPIGFLFPDNVGVSLIAILGALISIGSVVVTLKNDSIKEVKV